MIRLEILGKNIAKYRQVKGLSQEKLAEIVDFHANILPALRGDRKI